ncbi:MAG TPA: c-type cytochrome [Methylomirabilota bacterium]|nr:c-type cytochrome [Methylomirabilota bacterium]
MQWRVLWTAVMIGLGGVARGAEAVAEDPEQARVATAIEALSRLPNTDLSQNARLKDTVFKLLDKTRGTPSFVSLVRQFKIPDQSAGLLEVITRHPASEAAVEAVRLLAEQNDAAGLRAGLRHTNQAAAVVVAEVLGTVPARGARGLLLDVVRDPAAGGEVRRRAVRSLAQTREGAEQLLALGEAGDLAEELRFTAASELNRVRWPEVQAKAATVFPPPTGRGAEPLPSVAELVKRTGDAANGRRVFHSPAAACATCHRVKGEGVDFGPDLSEIGTKLGKDALYEAILDPSAGVSFGYEAWQVQLKSGDETYGLLAGETADDIAIKTAGGIVTRYPKSQILDRQKMKLSIMPAGLHEGLTTAELVDLVEYLTTLRKP